MPAALAPVAPRPVAPAVHIGVYDGPLDLLLFLVRREGVDVRSIPVARICDAYLAMLRDSDVVDVDDAGDYLLMAATLCQLKARDLLPRAPGPSDEEVEEEDPRERLQRRLIEYERYRLAALALDEMPRLDRDEFSRPATEIAPEEQPMEAGVNAYGLLRMYYALVARSAAPPPVHAVHREPIRLADAVHDILQHLNDGQEHLLGELLATGDRPRKVFTFLACLEMARRGLVDLRQLVHLGAVRIRALVRAEDVDISTITDEALTPTIKL